MVRLGSLLEENIPKKSISLDDIVTFVGMQDVSEDAILNTQHAMKYSDVKKGLTYFEKNDVLVAKITPCFENGKGAYLDILETDIGFGSTEFHVLRANENAEPAYIYQHTNTRAFRSKLEMNMVGTAGHRRVLFSALQEYLLPVKHTRQEQKAIAKALSDVDELIASLEKLIAKKRDIKTATMQQLLTGKKRLPGSGEGKGYKQTELGVIPEDWDVKPIGDLLRIRHGKSQKQVFDPNGDYPILATGGEIGRAREPLYSKPSVLIGRKGTIDIPCYMDTPFWTVDTLFYSEVSNNADAKFMYYKFLFIDWYQYNEASGVPSLNAATIEKIVQAVPNTKDEQSAISDLLTEFDTEINLLKVRLEKTKAIKQGMMQELLTGKTRLINPEGGQS